MLWGCTKRTIHVIHSECLLFKLDAIAIPHSIYTKDASQKAHSYFSHRSDECICSSPYGSVKRHCICKHSVAEGAAYCKKLIFCISKVSVQPQPTATNYAKAIVARPASTYFFSTRPAFAGLWLQSYAHSIGDGEALHNQRTDYAHMGQQAPPSTNNSRSLRTQAATQPITRTILDRSLRTSYTKTKRNNERGSRVYRDVVNVPTKSTVRHCAST